MTIEILGYHPEKKYLDLPKFRKDVEKLSSIMESKSGFFSFGYKALKLNWASLVKIYRDMCAVEDSLLMHIQHVGDDYPPILHVAFGYERSHRRDRKVSTPGVPKTKREFISMLYMSRNAFTWLLGSARFFLQYAEDQNHVRN